MYIAIINTGIMLFFSQSSYLETFIILTFIRFHNTIKYIQQWHSAMSRTGNLFSIRFDSEQDQDV